MFVPAMDALEGYVLKSCDLQVNWLAERRESGVLCFFWLQWYTRIIPKSTYSFTHQCTINRTISFTNRNAISFTNSSTNVRTISINLFSICNSISSTISFSNNSTYVRTNCLS